MIPGIKDIKVGDKQILKVYTDNKIVWQKANSTEYEIKVYKNSSLEEANSFQKELQKRLVKAYITKNGDKYDISIHTKEHESLSITRMVIGRDNIDYGNLPYPQPLVFEFKNVSLDEIPSLSTGDNTVLGTMVKEVPLKYHGTSSPPGFGRIRAYLVFVRK